MSLNLILIQILLLLMDRLECRMAIKLPNMVTVSASNFERVISNESETYNFTGEAVRFAIVQKSHGISSRISFDSNGRKQLEPCLVLQMIQALQYCCNINAHLIFTETWGEFNKTTLKWDGSIGNVLDGTADIGLSPSSITPRRYRVVDFVSFHVLPYSAFYKKPNIHQDLTALIRPFSSALWQAIFVWLVILVVVLIADYIIRKRRQDGASYSWSDCLVWPLEIICQHGPTNVPDSTTLKSLLVAANLTAVALYAVYSGNLLSFLSAGLDTFATLAELISAGFKFSVIGNSMRRSDLERSPVDVLKALHRLTKNQEDYDEFYQVKEAILAGSRAFLTDRWRAHSELNGNYSRHERCSIAEVPFPIKPELMGLFIPKNSRYKFMLKHQVVRFRQMGLLSLWIKRYYPRKPDCRLRKWNAGFSEIAFSSVVLPIGFLGAGMVLSTVLMALEKLMSCT